MKISAIESNLTSENHARLMKEFFSLSYLKPYFDIVDRFPALVSTSLSLLPLIMDGQ